jgi:GNAT superfamily N-acetyltransferase
MASTESAGATDLFRIRPLAETDLPGCLALSRSANWNQNEADWRLMLGLGCGWGIEADGPVLAGSVVVVPYPSGAGGSAATAGCAWVSMVLVLPQFQHRGLAKRLLSEALAYLHDRQLVPVLDATPAGYPVYIREGFAPFWGFRRYRRAAVTLDPAAAAAPRTRPICDADWPGLLALDAPAFGADRTQVLRALAGRMPAAARVTERDGRISGFIFGRDGLEACQLGPLVARDAGIAQLLIDDVLDTVAGPVQIDLADRHLVLLEGLVARGFLLQRPFTRMARDASPPGDPEQVVLVAGPELG